MRTVRIFFSKCDRAKYISHLDITRCLSRSFARTNIPIWYTEGFNPHIYMTFALPLPLGFEGLRESMDIKITDDEYPLEKIAQELNPVLPWGIQVWDAALPIDKPEAIAFAEYEICMHHSNMDEFAKALDDFFAQESIVVTKKSKRKTQEMDIRPLFEVLEQKREDRRITIRLRIAAGPTLNINPLLLLGTFEEQSELTADYTQYKRTMIQREDLTEFR